MFFKFTGYISKISYNKLIVNINNENDLIKLNNISENLIKKNKKNNVPFLKGSGQVIIKYDTNSTKIAFKKIKYSNIDSLIGKNITFSCYTKYYFIKKEIDIDQELLKQADISINKEFSIIQGYTFVCTKMIDY